MTEPVFFSRDGLLVEMYDPSFPEIGDVPFYTDLAGQTGGPVLELGSGTGRVVWPLAEAGLDVVGLDLSAPMLKLAEAKRAGHPEAVASRVRFETGDMARFELPERFRLVYSACRAFQALLTPEDQRACLECVHRHLEPGGLLILTLFDPRLDRCVDGEVEDPYPPDTYRHPGTGCDVEIEITYRRNDAVRQVLFERWRLTERDAQGRTVRQVEEVLEIRWTYRYEMAHLLELCGFHVEAEYSDFKRSPPKYAADQIWVARRA
ncbi:MAG: class I SAM-dependent DNA methyltransferase [Planctomycetota bacterium]